MTKSKIAAIILTLGLTGLSRPVQGQYFPNNGVMGSATGNIDGFSVTGIGTVKAKPNRMEIDLEVSAASELSADAIVKYRDARKRLSDAFLALKLNNVTVEERGLQVNQKGAEMNPYFWDVQPNRRSKVEVQLTRKLVVKCSDIRKLDEETLLQLVAKLLDVAQDAGGKIGPQNNYSPYYYRYENNNESGLVRFILDDFDSLEEEAYAKAVEDAKARAARLAKLSGVKLGPVLAVREALTPRDRQNINNSEDQTSHKRLESARFQEIPVRVELLVRFDTVKEAGSSNGRPNER